LAKAAAGADMDWEITVSALAPGYTDSVFTLKPTVGTNELKTITLREAGYESVEIAGKRWMKKNLNIETADSWCYNESPDSCAKYGRLYTWQAAMTACPAGWHLPTREEWGGLAIAAGGTDTYGDRGNINAKLKSTSGWSFNSGTDDFGFSALPGGYRNTGDSFVEALDYGFWWTATEDGSVTNNAYLRYTGFSVGRVREDSRMKSNAFSVRCVQND